jgi:hypothetical protein
MFVDVFVVTNPPPPYMSERASYNPLRDWPQAFTPEEIERRALAAKKTKKPKSSALEPTLGVDGNPIDEDTQEYTDSQSISLRDFNATDSKRPIYDLTYSSDGSESPPPPPHVYQRPINKGSNSFLDMALDGKIPIKEDLRNTRWWLMPKDINTHLSYALHTKEVFEKSKYVLEKVATVLAEDTVKRSPYRESILQQFLSTDATVADIFSLVACWGPSKEKWKVKEIGDTTDTIILYGVAHLLGTYQLYPVKERQVRGPSGYELIPQSFCEDEYKAFIIDSMMLLRLLKVYNEAGNDELDELKRNPLRVQALKDKFDSFYKRAGPVSVPNIIIVIEHRSNHWIMRLFASNAQARFDSLDWSDHPDMTNFYKALWENCIKATLQVDINKTLEVFRQRLHAKQMDDHSCGLHALDWLEWVLPQLLVTSYKYNALRAMSQVAFKLYDTHGDGAHIQRHNRLRKLLYFKPRLKDLRGLGITTARSIIDGYGLGDKHSDYIDFVECITHVIDLRERIILDPGIAYTKYLLPIQTPLGRLRGYLVRWIPDGKDLTLSDLGTLCTLGSYMPSNVLMYCLQRLAREHHFVLVHTGTIFALREGTVEEIKSAADIELKNIAREYIGKEVTMVVFPINMGGTGDEFTDMVNKSGGSHWACWVITRSRAVWFDSLSEAGTDNRKSRDIIWDQAMWPVVHRYAQLIMPGMRITEMYQYQPSMAQDAYASCGVFVIEWIRNLCDSDGEERKMKFNFTKTFKCEDSKVARLSLLKWMLVPTSKRFTSEPILITLRSISIITAPPPLTTTRVSPLSLSSIGMAEEYKVLRSVLIRASNTAFSQGKLLRRTVYPCGFIFDLIEANVLNQFASDIANTPLDIAPAGNTGTLIANFRSEFGGGTSPMVTDYEAMESAALNFGNT